MAALTCLFIVQGEGRGHMTQALALRAMLDRAGHRVAGVLVGQSRERDVPAFFVDGIAAPVSTFASPGFVKDEQARGIAWGATLARNARRVPAFRAGLRHIDAWVQQVRPDVLVGFYEPLAGLYTQLYRPSAPFVSVAHQYMFFHPRYPFPPGHWLQRGAMTAFTRVTALGAASLLALSVYEAPSLPERRLVVLPPLLRDGLFDLPLDLEEPFVLVYLLNPGYADDIRRWHAAHPEVALHCFWDHPTAEPVESVDETLTFHRLHAGVFLERMARCCGVVTTAGFESMCEAAYLGKPLLMVPVCGHFEQHCNALDGVNAGLGIQSSTFAVDKLLDYLSSHCPPNASYRAWVHDAEARVVREIESAVKDSSRFNVQRSTLGRQTSQVPLNLEP